MALDYEKLTADFETKLESPEFKAEMIEYFGKKERIGKIRERQYERLSKLPNLSEFIEKVIKKYKSDVYVDKYYRHKKRPQEPPTDLYYDLHSCAELFGREATDEEYEKYGCMFTVNIFVIGGYAFDLISGQGTAIRVHKI